MEVTNITKSYSYRLSHAVYGGNQYESSDHFCSLSAEVEEGENILDVSQELTDTAKELVNKSVLAEIASFGGGIPSKEFEQFLYDFVAGRVKSPEVFDDTRKKLSRSQSHIVDIVRRAKNISK